MNDKIRFQNYSFFVILRPHKMNQSKEVGEQRFVDTVDELSNIQFRLSEFKAIFQECEAQKVAIRRLEKQISSFHKQKLTLQAKSEEQLDTIRSQQVEIRELRAEKKTLQRQQRNLLSQSVKKKNFVNYSCR